MLGKIILTAAVILLAFVLIRQKGLKQGLEEGLIKHNGEGHDSTNSTTQARAQLANNKQGVDGEKQSSLNRDLRFGAYLFLALMTGLGGALYYYDWQDDHTIITVNLHRDGQQEPVSYEVYKFQLGERSFTTLDGVNVTVAASERMEVLGLND